MNQTRRGKCQIEPDTSAMLPDKWDRGSKFQIRVANRTYKPWPQGYYLQNTHLTNCSKQEWNMDFSHSAKQRTHSFDRKNLVAYFNQCGLGLRAGQSRDWIPVGGEIFCTYPDWPWGPFSHLYKGYRVFPRGKVRPGRDADPSPPSNARVKNRVELYLYSP
jgi:hypothetical protein